MIKYIKIVLWIVAKSLSYIQDARYLKINSRINRLCCSVVMNADRYSTISLTSVYSFLRCHRTIYILLYHDSQLMWFYFLLFLRRRFRYVCSPDA